jgi:hypothetical protein
MSTLSIFDAARETPNGCALIEGARSISFASPCMRGRPTPSGHVWSRWPALRRRQSSMPPPASTPRRSPRLATPIPCC